jgi:hypothetical protein
LRVLGLLVDAQSLFDNRAILGQAMVRQRRFNLGALGAFDNLPFLSLRYASIGLNARSDVQAAPSYIQT